MLNRNLVPKANLVPETWLAFTLTLGYFNKIYLYFLVPLTRTHDFFFITYNQLIKYNNCEKRLFSGSKL